MPITMQGWTGDFGGQLPGRKPLQALIALSTDAGDAFVQLLNAGSPSGPFHFLHVTSTLPGARLAEVAKVTLLGPLLCAVDIEVLGPGGDNHEPWPAGVNLVNIAANNPLMAKEPLEENWSCSTFATVLVAAKLSKPVPPKKPSGGTAMPPTRPRLA